MGLAGAQCGARCPRFWSVVVADRYSLLPPTANILQVVDKRQAAHTCALNPAIGIAPSRIRPNAAADKRTCYGSCAYPSNCRCESACSGW